jgi:predicted AlkP superfamily phosphohydrolase/phosphomutase
MTARCLFVGWDGADWDVLEPMMQAGLLPNLLNLRSTGRWGPLQSTFPHHSVAAWTSFLCAGPVSHHGVVDFTRPRAGRYFPDAPVTFRDVPTPTLLDALGAQGFRVLCANVPMTFPPRSINGWLVSGVFLPEGASFVHPPELAGRLHELGGFPTNAMRWTRSTDLVSLCEEARKVIQQQTKVFRDLLESEDWDVALFAFMAPDRVQHPAMHLLVDAHPAWPGGDDPAQNALLNVYSALDAALGDLVHTADANTVVLASDHGFRPVWLDVVPNRLLEEMGYLNVRRNAARARMLLRPLRRIGRRAPVAATARRRLGLENIIHWESTRAYAPSTTSMGIRMNLRRREPQGAVYPRDADELLDRLRTELSEVQTPDGTAAFTRLIAAEDLGLDPQHLPGSPDLFYELGEGVGVSAEATDRFNASRRKTGEHRGTGIIVVGGRSTEALPDQIWEVAGTIVRASGGEMSLFDGDSRRRADPKRETSSAEVSDEEQASIRRHLQDLGYIE